MAKGGKRTYTRDGNGRFASTPGSAAKKAAKSVSGRKSTLGARTGLKGSRAKLKAKDKADQTLQNTLSTRAQKGAVKRGSRKLAAAKTAASRSSWSCWRRETRPWSWMRRSLSVRAGGLGFVVPA